VTKKSERAKHVVFALQGFSDGGSTPPASINAFELIGPTNEVIEVKGNQFAIDPHGGAYIYHLPAKKGAVYSTSQSTESSAAPNPGKSNPEVK
jgi:hypothetical protein